MKILRSVALALLAVWFVLPLVPVLLWAVANRWPAAARWPQTWGVSGWLGAGRDGAAASLVASLVLGVAVALVATPLGVLAGRALGWRRLTHPSLSAVLLLLPVALPPFAVAMGLDVVALRLHVPPLVAVVVLLAVFALPYTTYILRAAFAGLDPQLEEQAALLGATPALVQLRVTLPALRPALAAAAGMAFLVGWSDYAVTLIVGSGRIITLPILLGASASGTGNEPTTSALAVLAVAPILAAGALAIIVTRAHGVRRKEKP